MASEKDVTLLDFLVCPFGQRAHIALAEKGVQYQHKEQNLVEKSDLLLKSNPVHKKIPVLIHDGKPVCESLIIVQYIDEVWSDKALLLLSDPYQKAQACFWADYVDKKPTMEAEGRGAAKKEMIEILQLLKAQLGDNKYFGGDTFGIIDIAFVPFTSWFYSYEICANLSIEEVAPKIVQWTKRCMERESVAKTLPDAKKIYEFSIGHRVEKNLAGEHEFATISNKFLYVDAARK